jgi:hypothetical protein
MPVQPLPEKAEHYYFTKSFAFQANEERDFFRRSLTCGYENWAFQAFNI